MVTFQGSIPSRSGVSISIVVVMCHWSQVEAERMELMKAKHSDIGNELILLQSHHDNYRCFDRLYFNWWIYMDYIWKFESSLFLYKLDKILNAHTTWKETWMASTNTFMCSSLFGRRVSRLTYTFPTAIQTTISIPSIWNFLGCWIPCSKFLGMPHLESQRF